MVHCPPFCFVAAHCFAATLSLTRGTSSPPCKWQSPFGEYVNRLHLLPLDVVAEHCTDLDRGSAAVCRSTPRAGSVLAWQVGREFDASWQQEIEMGLRWDASCM